MDNMNIKEILEEIYKIDPTLREREGELIKVINTLYQSRPDVAIDENFVARLRDELQVKFGKQSIVGQTYVYKNPFRALNVGIVGSFAVVLLFVVATSYIGFQFIKTDDVVTLIGEGEKKVAVNKEEGTVVLKKEEGGIVTKKEDTGKVIAGFVKFESEEEYRKYIEESEQGYLAFGGDMESAALDMDPRAFAIDGVVEAQVGVPAMDTGAAMGEKAAEPTRVSETNVQVSGIDEPDILKTDGKEIYFSPERNYYYDRVMTEPVSMPMMEPEMGISVESDEMIAPYPPEYNKALTHVIKAFPVEELGKESNIDKAGDLLLKDDTLVIFEDRNIYGYDVSDPENPEEAWNVAIDSNNTVVDARLHGSTIYLITQTAANRYHPCPIPLFETGGRTISVRCEIMYHPVVSVPSSVNYHISTVDVSSGNITEGISFVGSYDSTIYMSPNGIYVAYAYEGDLVETFFDFLKENSDLVSSDLLNGIAKLTEYDISKSSKMNEFEILLQEYFNSLDGDELLRIENEMTNRLSDYLKEHKRDLQKTDVVKIDVKDLTVSAQGTVPGELLNQFSMDEYKGNLRVATTIGGGFFRFGGAVEQENDVYVLDDVLQKIGSVKGLGLTESIYSARFIEDKGYIVTFRRIDPFYVLDLSDPTNPQMKGELKIPGYSSYLHPITKDKILGVGKEGSQVKISLFDVSDPANPKEADKFILEEYWSDILNTHHAFLLDDKHEVFFIPGGRGGYVFSYTSDTLTMKKAVSGITAKRALFIDDNLYIAGDDKIVVLDENTWEKVNTLELK